ncbi:MAG: FliM/FliN family flagellar motor switch protein [Pirellulales bacterium]|nr:FliM/FliN family flagellar motor switch protein [Pirellulales bacterium]
MSDLGPQSSVAICESLSGKQSEFSQLLGTAFGGRCSVEEIKVITEDDGWREALKETQLVVGLLTSATGIVLTIPKSIAGDGTASDKKWRTLSEDLHKDFLADHFTPSSFQVTVPEDTEYISSSLTPDAACLEISIQFGDADHKAYLVFPLAHLILLFTEPPPEEVPTAADFAGEEAVVEEESPAPTPPQAQAETAGGTFGQSAPEFSHSLMQIKLPVMVSLARKKLEVKRILDISPGSLIQFDKFCEDLLDVEAAERKIALGEAVKVGDKFGIRITSLVLPQEKFVTVKQAKHS